MYEQHTLTAPVSCRGIGLHTGADVSVTVKPAPADHGIVFVRTDKTGPRTVNADFKNVGGTSFATTLHGPNFFISTVEHLMSALAGMGVDNAVIEVDGDEMPIMDGSSKPFAYLLSSAGLKAQEKPRKYIQILQPIVVAEGDRFAGLYPSDNFKVSFSIEFDHPIIKTQRFDAEMTSELFSSEIAPARTFGFLNEINMLKANGFAAGGGLENAIVVGNYTVLNKGGLRYKDEFVRHKVLDAMGDLYLAGHPILGQLVCKKSGHGLNHKLVSRLYEEKRSWRYVELVPAKQADNEKPVPLAVAN
jgi:UDP-3-O-[3-hydroxymyristoyl] N-acetylglucosamine deacetylase